MTYYLNGRLGTGKIEFINSISGSYRTISHVNAMFKLKTSFQMKTADWLTCNNQRWTSPSRFFQFIQKTFRVFRVMHWIFSVISGLRPVQGDVWLFFVCEGWSIHSLVFVGSIQGGVVPPVNGFPSRSVGKLPLNDEYRRTKISRPFFEQIKRERKRD